MVTAEDDARARDSMKAGSGINQRVTVTPVKIKLVVSSSNVNMESGGCGGCGGFCRSCERWITVGVDLVVPVVLVLVISHSTQSLKNLVHVYCIKSVFRQLQLYSYI